MRRRRENDVKKMRENTVETVANQGARLTVYRKPLVWQVGEGKAGLHVIDRRGIFNMNPMETIPPIN